jgi:dipeptidyl aminopeptidase/acylaminoacyl peptidase
VRVPWLLVHGDADELVPFQDSIDARAAAGGRPDLVVLPGVDHRFTDAIPAMSMAVVEWLRRQLGTSPS